MTQNPKDPVVEEYERAIKVAMSHDDSDRAHELTTALKEYIKYYQTKT